MKLRNIKCRVCVQTCWKWDVQDRGQFLHILPLSGSWKILWGRKASIYPQGIMLACCTAHSSAIKNFSVIRLLPLGLCHQSLEAKVNGFWEPCKLFRGSRVPMSSLNHRFSQLDIKVREWCNDNNGHDFHFYWFYLRWANERTELPWNNFLSLNDIETWVKSFT